MHGRAMSATHGSILRSTTCGACSLRRSLSSSTSPLSTPPAAVDDASSSYTPTWQFRRACTLPPPSPQSVLSTYRTLLRLLRRTASGQHQRWTDPLTPSTPTLPTPSPPRRWLLPLTVAYRTHQRVSDPPTISALHQDALDLAHLLRANLQHSREVYDAGWGMRQETRQQVMRTARHVGLEVGESRLDREVREELREEGVVTSGGQGKGGEVGDELAQRLEEVERRRQSRSKEKGEGGDDGTAR